MTPGTLPRHLLVGACSAALIAGGLVLFPLVGAASADACPTWTDPAGDSGAITPVGTDPTGLSADDDLDVVGTTVAVTPDGGMVVAVKVKALSATGPANSPGDEFEVTSKVAGTATTVTLARDTAFSGTEKATLAAAASATGTAKFDVPSSTVTGTFTAAQVKTAFGKAVAGLKMEAFETLAYGWTLTPVGPSLGFPETDDSAAPASLTYTDGGAGCGGSTPAPTGTGTPAPTGSGTPSAIPSPTSTPSSNVGSDGLFLQPRKGCFAFSDKTGDADPTGTGLDGESALDITQVALKSPSGALQLFVGLVDPSSALLPLWDGPVYSTTFTVGGKTVTLTASATGPATATVGTAANNDIKATAKLDNTAKNIVFTVPLVGLSKAVGATVARGTAITNTSAKTAADSLLGPQTADTATGTKPAEKTYTYGDNHCFLPPPGVIALDADPRGQYGDRTVVYATLHDADDTPVSGVKVSGILTGGRAVSDITDANGIATLVFPLTMAAGTKTLTVSYAGDPDVGPARSSKAFVVVPEKSVLHVAALRGGAQATVVDDDRPAHAIVGRYVRFTVGSKSYLRTTNSRGVAVLTGVKKGTAVKVTFLPVRNLYLGTGTVTVRAR